MKKNFWTGLILLLPFTLTLIILIWTINFLTNPFQNAVESILEYQGFLHRSFLFLSADQVVFLSSKIIILFVLFALLLFIGFLGQLVLMKTILKFTDYLITHIPFVNKIYSVIQDFVKTFFQSKGNAFAQVVAIPFPNANAYSLALMTKQQKDLMPCELVSVFLAGAPNPTFGFMVVCKTEDVVLIDMKVEDALKLIFSCGVMYPGLNQPKEA